MADIKSDKSEILHYDNPDFPVFIRKNYISFHEEISDMSIHWHDELEFIYVLAGDIRYLVDGRTVTMNAGEGIFVNSRHLHLIMNGKRDCVLLCIIFPPTVLCTTKYVSGKMVEPIIFRNDLSYVLLDSKIDWQKRVLCHLNDIYEHSLKLGGEMEILVSAYRLWNEMFTNVTVPEASVKHSGDSLSDIKKMIEYIQDNYQKKISLNDLCLHAGIGKNKCTMLFRKFTNLSPMQYLCNYRMEKGIELLKNTEMSITEIAFETGFSGASYFTENLRKHMGLSARQIRQRGKRKS